MQQRILDTAEDIVRSRGYNGFSYADVASILGVSKAALHHHFATKADLGLALINRFTEMVMEHLDAISVSKPDNLSRLAAYVDVYDAALGENKMCLCGLMAAEHETLAPAMQEALETFFDGHTAWLANVLENGRLDGEFDFAGPSEVQAKLILATMQGALMIAKAKKDFRALGPTGQALLEQYATKPAV